MLTLPLQTFYSTWEEQPGKSPPGPQLQTIFLELGSRAPLQSTPDRKVLVLPQWAGPLVCALQGDHWCDVYEKVNFQSMEATLTSQPLISNLEIDLFPPFF